MTEIEAGETYVLRGTLASGGTLIGDAGSYGVKSGARIEVRTSATNNGTIDLLAAPTYYGGYNCTGATLAISGTLTSTGLIDLGGGAAGQHYGGSPLTGAVLIDRGVLTNTGSIDVAAAFPAYDGDSGTGATLLDLGVLTNSGLITVQNGYYGGYGSSGGTVVVGAVLTNSGTIDVLGLTSNGYAFGQGGVLQVLHNGTLDNSGLLYVQGGSGTGTGSLSVAGLLVNTGTIQVGYYAQYTGAAQLDVLQGGTLDNQHLLGVFGNATRVGAMPAATPGLLDAGVVTNSDRLRLHGGSATAYAMHSGAGMLVTGTLSNTGQITVGGGFGAFADGGYGSGATLTNDGLLSNANYLIIYAGYSSFDGGIAGGAGLLIDNGKLTNSGTLEIVGSNALMGQGHPLAATLLVNGTLTNTGSIDINANSFFAQETGQGGVLVDAGLLTNTGTISLDTASDGTTGTLLVTATGVLTSSGTIGGGGSLTNAGVIASAAQGLPTGEIATASLVNDGTVEVAPGSSFVVDSRVTAADGDHGLFDIGGANATLVLGEAIAASQTVSFLRGGATLALAAAASFAGILDGLRPNTTIDFLKLDVTSAHASGTTLAIGLSSGTTLDLSLSAPLPSGNSLQLVSDGRGGTDLNIVGSRTDHSSGLVVHGFG